MQGLSGEPPPFVRLVSHPLRWRLLQELVQSDRTVRELMILIDEPQSLVSYHLRLLREGALVKARQSSADRRDSYYAIDLSACRDSLQSAGRALHPSLGISPAAPACPRARSPRRRPRVLFLCTGNSARSQIAEALLEHMSAGAIQAVSAGSRPKSLHPNAIRVLHSYGIDISANRTKHLDEFRAQRFDTVITLCDRVREVCPEFPSRPELVHWSVPDPALEGMNNRASYPGIPSYRSRDRDPHQLPSSPSSPVRQPQGGPTMPNDETVNVRYMVDDVEQSIAFYTELLGFEVLTSFAPAFADVKRGNLRLLLSGPKSSAGRPMPDGAIPGPGGWNRIHLIVDDIDAEVARLRDAGATFRNDVVTGPGGQQILLQDPSGNFVELFQPAQD